jgi:hypothetical protein
MGDRILISRWDHHHSNISDEIIEIVGANSMCDATITNGDEYVLVNTVILAACSPLFKSAISVSGKIFKRSF